MKVVKMPARVWHVLYELDSRNTAPLAGLQTTTGDDLRRRAEQARADCSLMLSILVELPPHADKDPLDMEDLLLAADATLEVRDEYNKTRTVM